METLLGVVVGFALAIAWEALNSRRAINAHWAVLKVEADISGQLAADYLNANIESPAYRCPTEGYNTAFPALLRAGQINAAEAKALMLFYSEIATWNRVLDQSAAAVLAGQSPRKEFRRGHFKAGRIMKPDGELFKGATAVLDQHA